jgi:hypothetical protein
MLVWILVLLWILESLVASSVVGPKPSLHLDQLADILSPGVRLSAGSATGSGMDANNVQSTTCGILMRKGLLSMSLLQTMDFWQATRYFPHVADVLTSHRRLQQQQDTHRRQGSTVGQIVHEVESNLYYEYI